MDIEDWANCVLVLRSSYGASFKLDTPAIAVWFEMLKDLPGDRIQAAIAHMVKHQAAFPSIADIRKLAEPLPADPGDAWRQACDYVSRLSLGPLWRDGGPLPLPEIEPWVKSALEAVGMDAIRNRTPDSEGTLRAHFVKFYQARLQRQQMAQSGLLDTPTDHSLRISALLPEVSK